MDSGGRSDVHGEGVRNSGEGTVKLRAYRPNRPQDVGNSYRASRTILRSFPRMLL